MAFSTLLFAVFSVSALAGLKVDRRLTAPGADETQTAILRESYDDQHQRVDMLDRSGKVVRGRLSLFDVTKAEMFLFEDGERKYLAASRKKFDALAKRPGKKSAPLEAATFTASGRRTVGRWDCTVYRVSRGTKRLGEICTVPLASLGLVRGDLGTFGHAQELAWDEGLQGNEWMNETRYGFPVEVRTEATKLALASQAEVLDVRKTQFALSHFSLPKGYRREEMPLLPGQLAAPATHETPVHK